MLEAGGNDYHPYIQIPLGLGKILDKRMFDWGYDYESDQGVAGRAIEATRGKVIGGSSSINVMAYVRGNRGDYDRWADKGATGWRYGDVLPYFKRCETFEGGGNTWRGDNGPLGVQFAGTKDPLLMPGWRLQKSSASSTLPTTTVNLSLDLAVPSTRSKRATAHRHQTHFCIRFAIA